MVAALQFVERTHDQGIAGLLDELEGGYAHLLQLSRKESLLESASPRRLLQIRYANARHALLEALANGQPAGKDLSKMEGLVDAFEAVTVELVERYRL